jgi:hypothetical protein
MTRSGLAAAPILRLMIASFEIVLCLAAVAGAASYTTTQYARLRGARRCAQALRRTLCTAE